MEKPSLTTLMGLNAGLVDTAGFLALHGLFTAHVTGNFVTIGSSLVLGTSGIVAKLLALPVFCIVILVTRMVSFSLPGLGLPVFRTMLTLQLLLLILGAALAIHFGPFPDAEDTLYSVTTGMVLVAAMAIQNAAHRIHLGSAPPTTMMTGTTTQIMIDIGELLVGAPSESKAAAQVRLRRMSASVAVFALGCAAGAFLYGQFGVWCFIAPPLIAAPLLFMQEVRAAA